MKNKIIFSLYFILTLSPHISLAAVNLPWSTTYNCNDWTQSNGLYNVNCDGLTGGGGWTCNNGDGTVREDQITSAANYTGPGSGGGKGQRHWLGDGANNVSGGTSISFNSTQSELWIRWYMRYENGFQWNPLNNQKIFIVNNLAQNRTIIGYTWSDETRIEVSQYAGYYGSGTNNGWNTIMANGGTDARGNKTSDGQWHLYEVHLKTDTNGSNGIAEMWVDDIRRLSYSNAYFGSAGFDDILIGSNSRDPLNGRCMAVDYDDIAIRTTGPIGPVGGGSGGGNTPPPSSGGGGSGSGGDSGSGGGGGCGFVKDINGKGPKAKGEGLALIIMLLLSLAGISVARRLSNLSNAGRT